MTTTTLSSAADRAGNRMETNWSLQKIVGMHLLPGLIIVSVYAAIAWFLRPLKLPSLLPLALAIPISLVPVELGILLYRGKQLYGRYTLRGVLPYSEALSWRSYAVWIPVTFVASLALFIVVGLVDGIMYETFFSWWPAWMNPDYGSLAGTSPGAFWGTLIMLMLMGNWLGPAIEELYFRGYLLPHMEHLGRWAVVLNSMLFALYHFWSPWYFISRSAGVLPLAIAARYKRNVYIPLVVHCTLNTVGTLLALGMLFG